MVQRIGVLGGTFNPVHLGHLIIAQAVAEKCHLHCVLFIPYYRPPHTYKHSRGLIKAKHRLQMLRRATADNPLFKVSDIEVKQGGKSYSIDTIRLLQTRYPKGTKFYFIIGADTLKELSSWRAIDELLKLCRFVIVARPDKIRGRSDKRLDQKFRRICHLDQPRIGISSTEIRTRTQKGQPIKYLVPTSVERYIIKHKLYK